MKVVVEKEGSVHEEDKEDEDEDEESGDGDDALDLESDNEEDDEMEDECDGDMFPSCKSNERINDDDKDEEPSSKRRRTDKPATAEEMRSLTESESSFASSLLRIQTEEMLKEIKPSPSIVEKIEAFVRRIKETLEAIPADSTTTMLRHLESVKGVAVPFRLPSGADVVQGSFSFAPPTSVRVAGDFRFRAACRPKLDISVVVEIPSSMWHKKDALNLRYVFKRAAYLARLGAALREDEQVESAEFEADDVRGEIFGAQLVIRPLGNWAEGVRFLLRCFTLDAAHAEAEGLKFAKSLVDPAWFFLKSPLGSKWAEGKKEILYAAHYENAILRDLTFQRNEEFLAEIYGKAPNLIDGVILLKTFLRQRGLDIGVGSLTPEVAVIFVAYLVVVNAVSKDLSGFHVFRKTLLALSDGTFVKGISLHPFPSSQRLDRLGALFDVVVLDRAGLCNLTPQLTHQFLRRVSHESGAALACLDESSHARSAFDAIFLHALPRATRFDRLVVVRDTRDEGKLENCLQKKNLFESVFSRSGSSLSSITASILEVLQRGFGSRATQIVALPVPHQRWPLADAPPNHDQSELVFGVDLNPENHSVVMEKGPSPEEFKAAKEFREFYGDLCETRRFKDGTILEAVLWHPNRLVVHRRSVTHFIASRLLKKHFGFKKIFFLDDELERVLRFQKPKSKAVKAAAEDPKNGSLGTGEEQQSSCVAALDDLAKILRELSAASLPLRVTGVQGIAPVFRLTDPFPPLRSFYGQSNAVTGILNRDANLGKRGAKLDGQVGERIPLEEKDGVPEWVPGLEVLLTLELSGKWPEDLHAFSRVKSSFLLAIARALREKGLSISLTTDCVKVLKGGYVFCLSVVHPRELALLKRRESNSSQLSKGSEENVTPLEVHRLPSSVFHRRHFRLPQIAGAINGLNAQFPGFSASCRIFKRWVASQMLSGSFEEVALEMLVGYVFLHPQPFSSAPVSPQTGFLRVLLLLATWDWRSTPILLNFNDELSPSDFRRLRSELEEKMRERREGGSGAALVLGTPFDTTGVEWTLDRPAPFVLGRLIAVAKAALRLIVERLESEDGRRALVPVEHLKSAFRPPLDDFNILVRLKKTRIPRRSSALDDMMAPEALTTSLNPREKGFLPVSDFDPAQRLLKDLRDSYSHTCHFFHDPYGGDVIGVLWRPEIMKPTPWNRATLTAPGRRAVLNSSSASTGDVIEDLERTEMIPSTTEFDVEALVEDISILGEGIVESVEVKTGNWN